jgi:peptidoglycan-associated lipoprotein
MRKSLFVLIGGLVGITLVMSACAKKQTKGEEGAMKEERVESSADMGEEMPAVEEPGMQESEMEPAPVAPKMKVALSSVLFDFDKFNIREDQRPALESNAKWLKDNSGVSVTIEGHADERGTNEYNLALGERRAQATKRYLATLGIDKKRLMTISYGEERPVCMENNEPCYSKNRRAQFEVRK